MRTVLSFLILILIGLNQPLMGNEIKTLVLIIASDHLPVYPGLQKIWKSYMDIDPEHFECYFIRGNEDLPTLYSIENDTIWSKTKERLIPGILNKTLLSLKAMEPRLSEFDYVLRTNLSSFFIFPQLLNFLKTLPRISCYSGPSPYHHFIGGSGIIMSTDVSKLLIDNLKTLYNSPGCYINVPDDVAIGRFLNKNGIKIIEKKWFLISDLSQWIKNGKKIPQDVFQIRVKTKKNLRQVDDLAIHLELLDRFYNIKLNIDD